MRPVFIFLFAIVFFNTSFATIRTVSNSLAYPGQYSTIGAAISASADGDTIYVLPSTLEYDAPVFSKRLVLIGSGIDPRRPSHLTTWLRAFTLSATAGGSSIMGFYCYGGSIFGDPSNYINGLYISDCLFVDNGGGSMSLFGINTIVENCIITGTLITGGGSVDNIFRNNIFNGGIGLHPGSNAIITNNIFANNDQSRQAFPQQAGGEFMGAGVQITNNIFFKTNPAGGVGQVNSCTFKNNIYYLTIDPVPSNVTSSGNLNADPQFVNFPALGAVFAFQYDYHLQPTSPGINFGTDGHDIGMWGGPYSVNAGFEPPIPRIYDLKVNNANVPVGGTFQITIKATKAQ